MEISTASPLELIWKIYFPDQNWDSANTLVSKVESWSRKLFTLGFQTRIESFLITGPQVDRGIDVSYRLLLETIGEEFARDFDEMPETCISIIGAALRLLAGNDSSIGKITARVSEHPGLTLFKDLKACNIGRFLTVRGTAVRVGPVKPLNFQMAFTCVKCSQTTITQLQSGICRMPLKCPTYHCTGRQFTPDRTSPETICKNSQNIKIQELLSDDINDCGRIPRTLDCELLDDLVDSISPGENVTISGTLHVLDSDDVKLKAAASYSLTLRANSVIGSKNMTSSHSSVSVGTKNSIFSADEREEILTISRKSKIFKLLVDSLCPDIFGHELVKAGLMLALFRGGEHTTRSNPHVLVIGDPGLGKSQMLTAVASVAPRAVFVGANTSTAAGLTATLHQDGGPGEYALEAGALVLADQGCCCIDEFDKLTEHKVLLDVMEQQVVNVAKAGVICSLPARTSVLASANPVGGHYNHNKTISQNIKLDDALISRFDLIFVLLDHPNEEIDQYLTEQIISKISNKSKDSFKKSRTQSQQQSFSKAKTLCDEISEFENVVAPQNFLKLLTKNENTQNELLSPHFIRKYISYAHHFISPKMSSDAIMVLKDFYMSCRSKFYQKQKPSSIYPPVIQDDEDSLLVTTRQLESAMRLSEARAKAELRSIVTKEDAEDVVSLMSYCMFECFKKQPDTDKKNNMTFSKDRIKSKNVVMKEFLTGLSKIISQTGDNDFSLEQLNRLYSELFPPGAASITFNDLMESLNHHGHVLKKPGNMFKTCL